MQKKHLTLLLPSLLTGCAGFASPPESENAATALVFVDGQISESSSLLAQTQRRLSPPPVSHPAAVTNTSAQAVTAQSLPLPAPVLTADASLSNIIMTGTPGNAPVTAQPLTRNRTVSDWVKQLLPAGWQFRQENAATPALRTRIASWSANDQWTRSLNRLLAEQHLWGHLDWKNRTLTVTTSPAAPATDSSPQATGPAPAPLPAPGWTAEKGATLRQTLTRWAAQVPCTITGHQPGQTWSVVWSASVDYPIDAAFTLRGGWKDVLTQTFNLYSRANTPLMGTLFEKQCILSVRDRKD
ncbi:toxin co-regulated pilus biosynthesis Q family protein [Escherichia coli]|nr:toxin co-regulated pilus biosynthesis Q family protein [Escherichia coli]